MMRCFINKARIIYFKNLYYGLAILFFSLFLMGYIFWYLDKSGIFLVYIFFLLSFGWIVIIFVIISLRVNANRFIPIMVCISEYHLILKYPNGRHIINIDNNIISYVSRKIGKNMNHIEIQALDRDYKVIIDDEINRAINKFMGVES